MLLHTRLSSIRFQDTISLLKSRTQGSRSFTRTCYTRLPKQNDLRNFLMSEECLELEQLVANMS